MQSGLECLTQRGSLAQLRLFNRPAVLNVIDSAGRAHQLVLAGLDDEHAQVDLGGAQREIGIGDLSRSWFGDYVLLWRPAAGGSQPLALGARNARVKWLRDSLRRVNGLPAEERGQRRFDAALVTLVEDFQRKNRLAVDGIAGVQTQVALDAALNDADHPLPAQSIAAPGADMSFILDALKKSENDRQRQASPALFEVKVAAPRRRFPAVGRRPRGVVGRQRAWCSRGCCCASPPRRRAAAPPPPAQAPTPRHRPSSTLPRRHGAHTVQHARRFRAPPSTIGPNHPEPGVVAPSSAPPLAEEPLLSGQRAVRAAGLRRERLRAGADPRAGERTPPSAAPAPAVARRGARAGHATAGIAARPARLRAESGRTLRVHQHAQVARR